MENRFYYLWRDEQDVDYDEADAFVVMATTEQEARRIASESAGDEKAATWISFETSHCRPLDLFGPPRLVLRSFNAG